MTVLTQGTIIRWASYPPQYDNGIAIGEPNLNSKRKYTELVFYVNEKVTTVTFDYVYLTATVSNLLPGKFV